MAGRLPKQSNVNSDDNADGVSVQHCVFSSDRACKRCGVETRFPKSLRVCAVQDGSLESVAAVVASESTLPSGPGTELKTLLAGWPFKIVSSPDCKCNRRAAYMDAQGCDWCASEEGMAEIMAFLREAAEERGLPFLDVAARLLVRRAIANARKAEAKRAKEAKAAAAAEGRPA
jgi:hypothetical protein